MTSRLEVMKVLTLLMVKPRFTVVLKPPPNDALACSSSRLCLAITLLRSAREVNQQGIHGPSLSNAVAFVFVLSKFMSWAVSAHSS